VAACPELALSIEVDDRDPPNESSA